MKKTLNYKYHFILGNIQNMQEEEEEEEEEVEVEFDGGVEFEGLQKLWYLINRLAILLSSVIGKVRTWQ